MNYCIIDDEPIAHRVIEGYCEKLEYLTKVGNCYDAFEAMNLLNAKKVDLIFLDINMPELSGLDLLKTLQHKPSVIVTSAHQEYALEGYELNVSDYLLKPFSFNRFLKAIQKVTPKQQPVSEIAQHPKKTSLFLKGDKKTHQVHQEDILYIEAYGNYTKLFLLEEMLVIHEKISTFEEMLSEQGFIRVHKSYLVAIDKIKSIEGNRLTIGDNQVPIGQFYRQNLKAILG